MRNSINGAWLLAIVMVFMMIFIGYVTVAFNYSKAYRMKDELISAIEYYQGVNDRTLNRMAKIAKKYGYHKMKNCPDDYVGFNLNNVHAAPVRCIDPKRKSSVCIHRTIRYTSKDTRYYYKMLVFFGFSLPGFNELYSFNVLGETAAIYYPVDKDYFRGCSDS